MTFTFTHKGKTVSPEEFKRIFKQGCRDEVVDGFVDDIRQCDKCVNEGSCKKS